MHDDSDLLHSAFNSLNQSIAVLDTQGQIVYVNAHWVNFMMENGGTPSACALGANYLAVCRTSKVRPEEINPTDVAIGIDDVLKGNRALYQVEYPCFIPGMGLRWFLESVTPLVSPGHLGGIRGAVVAHIDITERKQAEQLLESLAFLDPLTNVPNRRMLDLLLENEVLRGQRHKTEVGVLYIDCDDFKKVNDTFGHKTGDTFLQELVHHLQNCVGGAGTIIRYGGDEFVVIVPRVVNRRCVINLGERILAAHQLAWHCLPFDYSATLSVGVAFYPDFDTSASLVHAADLAMYEAKRTGKNGMKVASANPS